jgi:cell division protein FtsB
VSLTNIHGRIDAARQDREAKEAERQSLEAGNAVMRSEIEHSTDQETIIHIARVKFNLVLPGETVYYDIGD